jgi:hypothetical protein
VLLKLGVDAHLARVTSDSWQLGLWGGNLISVFF